MPYTSKVHTADANDASRAEFAFLCEELSRDPGKVAEVQKLANLSTRADDSDRRAVGHIAHQLSLTKNAVQLIALRTGLELIGEILRERANV